MAGLLTKYNRSLRKQMQDVDYAKMADPLEKYRNAKEDEDILEIVFSFADKDGNLYMKDDDGILVRILYDDLFEAIPSYNTYIKDRFLGTSFVAKVSDIDEEENLVTVVSARSNGRSTKTRIIGEIQKSLSKGQEPRVVGRIVRVRDDKVYVDILCKEILGVCGIKYWRQGYVQDLHEEVKEGMLFEFEITGEIKPKDSSGSHRKAYLLSRLNLTDDPWDHVPETLSVGSAIIVKCVEKPGGKSYWWGSSDLVPGISIMCDYNRKVEEIRQSRYYKCKVFRLDREERRIQVTPIEETFLGFDPETLDNLKILSGKA